MNKFGDGFILILRHPAADSGLWSREELLFSIASMMRSDILRAADRVVFGKMTINSSPPYLPEKSVSRILFLVMDAKSVST